MCAEQIHDLQHRGSTRLIGTNLHEQHATLDGLVGVKLNDLQNIDELAQLALHLLNGGGVRINNDGHAGNIGVLGLPHRQ